MTTEEIDSHLDLQVIKDAQEAWFLIHNKYHYAQPTSQDFDPSVLVRVDEYNGPDGKGYLVVISSDTHIKTLNFGPETEREVPWSLL